MKKLFTQNSPVICEHYHGYNPEVNQCLKCSFKDKKIDAINAKGGIPISSHSYVEWYFDNNIQVLQCENCYHMDFAYYRYKGQDYNC